ncbi:Predicted alpha/beta hydrolase [Micromonospora nigra]|uniref:Predicted alpha/beta hydrolase n=1 Tax=Micromonospora nigra TaxID=145857 RepID=A0A1C6SS65_9ACTN|nr:alpha/beta fold hydrolase [Micromonospora nigra]SCL32494.1 Predicted alpha/beta hydrolase [Micromonospora nigra]
MNATGKYAQEFVEVDGARIGVQVYPEPEGVTDAPVVLVYPAMGVPARYYRPFAAALRGAGLAVAVADLRGTGESTPPPGRACRYGYAQLAADLGAVREALKPRLDGRRTLLLGHSLGGQAAVLHLALHGDRDVDGLVLVASGIPYWRDFTGLRGYGILPFTHGIAATARVLGFWPGWGFGGRQARGVIRDWAHTARTGRFPLLDGVDAEAAVGEVRTPVLAISVDGDQYTPHATLDRLCGKLTRATVRRERLTPEQTGVAVDHFTWVRAGTPLADRVADFAAGLPDR